MNDLLPRKLGEVQAFAVIGLELLGRAGDAAVKAFGEDIAREMRDTLQGHIAKVGAQSDAAKTEKTTLKLREMMEKYIGDEWDNPIELLEWSGFYLGAAGIHWSLVSGITTDDADLTAYASGQAAGFSRWLALAFERIKEGEKLKTA